MAPNPINITSRPGRLLRSLCLASGLLLGSGLQAQQVIMLADPWMPYNGDPNAAKPGYMIELVRSILIQHDHSLHYEIRPWHQALADTVAGKADCLIATTRESEHGLLFPARAWGADSTAIYVRSHDPWRYNGHASLEGRQIGTIKGYNYADELEKHFAHSPSSAHPADGIDALEHNLKRLLAGELDSVVENPTVMAYTLAQLGLREKVRHAGVIGLPNALYIACNPNRPNAQQYLKWLDEGLEDMRLSGQLKEVLDAYGVEDWQP